MEKENIPDKYKTEVLPKGSYFETDEEGFLVNPASVEKIQPEWRAAIDDVVEVFKKKYGDNLKSVYVRGSVSKGEAVQGISDLDTFAFVDLDEDEISPEWTQEAELDLKEKYPFIEGFELAANSLSDAEQKILMLNQSACVYGEPLEVKRLKIDEVPENSNWQSYVERLDDAKSFLQKDITEKQIKNKCVWVMKTILRLGAEATIKRSGKYTRDLYPCYQIFSEYYPEKEPEMREVLDYALNPTSDSQKVLEILNGLDGWLIKELEKHASPSNREPSK